MRVGDVGPIFWPIAFTAVGYFVVAYALGNPLLSFLGAANQWAVILLFIAFVVIGRLAGEDKNWGKKDRILQAIQAVLLFASAVPSVQFNPLGITFTCLMLAGAVGLAILRSKRRELMQSASK